MKTFLALFFAAVSFCATAASYYVVVPVPNKTVSNTAITVALSGYSLPTGLIGTPYVGFNFKSLLSVAGDPNYTGYGVKWFLASGSLPAGLTLSADGRVSGTPTSAGTASFQVRASYKSKTGEQLYRIVVANITVALAQGTPPQALVGQAYAYDLKQLLSITGDPAYTPSAVTWTTVSNSLPAGLYLTFDGWIGGTPTAGGTGSLTARATYKNAKGEQTYQVVSLNISAALAQGTPPQALVGQAYAYDLKQLLSVSGDPAYTPSAVTWTTVSNSLPAGLYLTFDGWIGGTPTAGGTGSITARATYKNAKGEQTYQVVSLNLVVGLAAAVPPQAVVGQAYSYDLRSFLTVTGDTAFNGSGVTWSVVSSNLPAGLYLGANGFIEGTPSEAGAGALTARATYRNAKGEQTYQVVSLRVGVSLAAATPPQALVGQAYSYDLKQLLAVTGDSAYAPAAVTWTVVANSLPAGLYLTFDGWIGGTPTAAGTGALTARATYKNVKGDQTYQVVSLNIAVTLSAATPPQATVGLSYSYDLKQQLSVTGDSSYTPSAVSWSVADNSLPAGLYITNDGLIGGTPTTSGARKVTVKAAYRNASATQDYVFSLSEGVQQYSGYKAWTDGTVAASCRGYRNPTGNYRYSGAVGDGVYRIKPGNSVVDVYCDMTTDGGGWTLVLTDNLPNFTNMAATGTTNVCLQLTGCNTGGTSTFYVGTPVEATLSEMMFTATSTGHPYDMTWKLVNPANFVRDTTPAPGISLFRLMTDSTPGWAPAGQESVPDSGDQNNSARMFTGTSGSWSDGNWHGTLWQQGMQIRLTPDGGWGHHHFTGLSFDGTNYTLGPWTYLPFFGGSGGGVVSQYAAENLYRWMVFVR